MIGHHFVVYKLQNGGFILNNLLKWHFKINRLQKCAKVRSLVLITLATHNKESYGNFPAIQKVCFKIYHSQNLQHDEICVNAIIEMDDKFLNQLKAINLSLLLTAKGLCFAGIKALKILGGNIVRLWREIRLAFLPELANSAASRQLGI